MIRVLRPEEVSPEENSQIYKHAGYTASPAWARLIEEQYRYPTKFILEGSGDGMIAMAALTFVNHPIFGRYAITAPYSSYGGAWFGQNSTPTPAFMQQVADLSREHACAYTNFRFLSQNPAAMPPTGLIQQPIYFTYKVPLNTDHELMLARYSSNHRNHVRKSLKKGFEIVFGTKELLKDAYEGLAASMRELGSPYHATSYLSGILHHLEGQVQLAIVKFGKQIIGAGVFIAQGDTIINLHANVLRQYRADYVGEFFYWSLIEEFTRQGFTTFDLGRSLLGSGNEVFKMKWAPERLPLQYWFMLGKDEKLPELNQKNPKFALAIETWKRLPPFVVRAAGPFLINGLA